MTPQEEITAFQAAWFEVFKMRLTNEEAALNAKQLMQAYALLTKYAE